MKFVVYDESNKSHLIEANTQAEAMTSVAGSVSVRVAQQRDIESFENQKPKVKKVKFR
jgi:uncharacterized protein YaiE (UPF0345 family)